MPSNDQETSIPSNARLVVGAIRYLASKVLTISIAIFIGVFITVLIANQPSRRGLGPPVSPFETSLEAQISLVVRENINNGAIGQDANGEPDQSQVDALTEKLRTDAGLNLPFLPRYLVWTVKALTFDWGTLGKRHSGMAFFAKQRTSASANDIIVQYLPNTLLLMGISYFLVLVIGMFLALYLARNRGNWLDRLFAILSPISSVPSWVFGVLLISVFAFELRWLPFGGMFDFNKPVNPVEHVLMLAKHMVLPVSAIVLSLVFQMVYTWRTFFIIYSNEDYVELAYAKGLPSKRLESQYILRPTLPYVITSFATTLISFWQLNMALEVIFQWPGLGWLYIKEALPNFWGESMEPGELIIVVGIVVIFAYLLGAVVFALDFVYVLIDPRIRLMPESDSNQLRGLVKPMGASWIARIKARMKKRTPGYEEQARGPAPKQKFSWVVIADNLKRSALDARARAALFFQELRRYPSAIFGLTIIIILFAGSVYAVTALSYEQVGRDYDVQSLTGRNYAPRTAMPAWTNWFSNPPRLSTIVMDEKSNGASVSSRVLDNGWVEKTTTFTFDYQYKDIPSEIFLYFDPKYKTKIPFASFEWTYPDGRKISLKPTAVSSTTSYDFESSVNITQLLIQNPQWKNWFVQSGNYPTPTFNLMFVEPNSSQPILQRGKYQLTIKTLLFEKDSDLQPQLVLLGQVYGFAGTDYWRRDLVVPLFWGMPFALLIGLLGSLITTLVAMLLPAIGVWFGGWVDNLVQRLSEINMVVPGLTIAVLTNVLFNINIWIILGIVITINALGSPIKVLRSALLQAKEAPYIETARAYGASDFRIIIRYLVPRILPVLIPLLVIQVPSFIFWEATLGFFNIKSTYPSWGRIIYDGLAKGALFGSPFWVLEPIFLLLLTGLAFAMFGSALERILNPRAIDSIPVTKNESKTGQAGSLKQKWASLNLDWRIIVGLVVLFGLIVMFFQLNIARTLSNVFFNRIPQAPQSEKIATATAISTITQSPLPASSPTPVSASVLDNLSTPTATVPPTMMPTVTVSASETMPVTYELHPGEFPYCIARRFNVDPIELLTLNGLIHDQTFYTGMVLQIPQSGKPFPGECMLRAHPATYVVSSPSETFYTVACIFGDVDPEAIAQANQLPVTSSLFVGQPLNIP